MYRVVLTYTFMRCLQLHSLLVGHSYITTHDLEFCMTASVHQSCLHVYTCMCNIHVHVCVCVTYVCLIPSTNCIFLMHEVHELHVHCICSPQRVVASGPAVHYVLTCIICCVLHFRLHVLQLPYQIACRAYNVVRYTLDHTFLCTLHTCAPSFSRSELYRIAGAQRTTSPSVYVHSRDHYINTCV